jgi:Tfp pilus assembly protein PilV
MRSTLKIRAGFTLVEVALAATILLVGFAGMAEALIIGSGMLDTARKQTIAAQIIQSEIEYWRLQPWTTITDTGPSGLTTHDADYLANYPEFASSSLATLVSTSFKFSRTVTYVPNRSNQILQVKMTVAWISSTGRLSSETWLNLHYDPISEVWTSTSSKLHLRSCNAYIGKYGLNVSHQKS